MSRLRAASAGCLERLAADLVFTGDGVARQVVLCELGHNVRTHTNKHNAKALLHDERVVRTIKLTEEREEALLRRCEKRSEEVRSRLCRRAEEAAEVRAYTTELREAKLKNIGAKRRECEAHRSAIHCRCVKPRSEAISLTSADPGDDARKHVVATSASPLPKRMQTTSWTPIPTDITMELVAAERAFLDRRRSQSPSSLSPAPRHRPISAPAVHETTTATFGARLHQAAVKAKKVDDRLAERRDEAAAIQTEIREHRARHASLVERRRDELDAARCSLHAKICDASKVLRERTVAVPQPTSNRDGHYREHLSTRCESADTGAASPSLRSRQLFLRLCREDAS